MYGSLEHNWTDIKDESEIWLIKSKYATLVRIIVDPYCAKNCSKNMILIWWTMIVIQTMLFHFEYKWTTVESQFWIWDLN